MLNAQLLSNGQVALPESICQAHHWQVGELLEVVNLPEGILLTTAKPFKPTTLSEVAGCLAYHGTPKTLEDMERAIAIGIRRSQHGDG